MKLNTRKPRIGVLAVALFMSCAFAVTSAAWATDSKDWTDKQLQEFVKKPWTQAELNAMGKAPRYVIKKEIPARVENPTKPEELFQNGLRQWRATFLQYGIGISSKDFYKLWIEQEGWKNPKIKLLDVRMESEFDQGHIPGAIRVDTGLAWWLLPGKAADPDTTYYVQCKGGAPENGGNRGAYVKKYMMEMGYKNVINITDGFRGYVENGFPVVNSHGLVMLVPGTFQIPEKDSMEKTKAIGMDTSTASLGLAQKFGLKDW